VLIGIAGGWPPRRSLGWRDEPIRPGVDLSLYGAITANWYYRHASESAFARFYLLYVNGAFYRSDTSFLVNNAVNFT
jgi:hypothetical protein